MTDRDLDEVLAAEAAEIEEMRERGDGLDRPLYRSKNPPRQPAQVYTLRMPIDRLEQLRQVADEQRESPSTLMRRWVLERLDQEFEGLDADHVEAEVMDLLEGLRRSVEAAREQRRLREVRRALRAAARLTQNAS